MKIRLVATDCDGVLTDGGLYYTEDGDVMKRFHVLDGVGFELLHEKGILTAVITAESHPLLQKRADKLRIDRLCMGSRDKLKTLQMLCREFGISVTEAAYIGDDYFDMPAIQNCGFGGAPSSAFGYVRECADYVTERRGGQGAFREFSEMVLQNMGQEERK